MAEPERRTATDDEMAGVRVREMLDQLAAYGCKASTTKAYAVEVRSLLRQLAAKHPACELLAAFRAGGIGDEVYPPASTIGRRVRG